MFSHVSSDCTDPIWSLLWKVYKIDSKTGLPNKDGSKIPPQPPRTHKPASAVVSPSSAHSAVGDTSVNSKTRYTGPPCPFCLSKTELKHIASGHSEADCRKRVKYAARQLKHPTNQSSSSSTTKPSSQAHVAQADAGGSSSALHAQVAQLSGTVEKLVSALNKKRKLEDVDETGELP